MKNTIRIMATVSVAAFAIQFAGAVPVVSNVEMSQTSGKRVNITYSLSEAAVVTLEVQTNANTSASAEDPGWTSIGGAAVSNAKGDVWKKVESGTRTITWNPRDTWPDHVIDAGGARAKVTAWALDNPPDYMVVDITSAAQPNTQKYYPGVDYLPGGILGNPNYRTGMLVLRKIMAKNVTWMMGSSALEIGHNLGNNANREATHQVTLTNNYYIGVFPITQTQWSLVATNSSVSANFSVECSMRPMENISYNEIRTSTTTDGNVDYYWPRPPHPSSFFGLLRTKTGIAFDFPSEAQWEFAARAGHGEGYWGDGSAITNDTIDANLSLQGRYLRSPATNDKDMNSPQYGATPDVAGTSIVGSYAPNSWGLYDMFGNLMEWCLDWGEDKISNFGGAVNVNLSNPAKTLSGADGGSRSLRGGSWSNVAGDCRPAYRNRAGAGNRKNYYGGIRVVCPVGIE